MAIADSGWRKIKAMFDLVLRIATAIDSFMSYVMIMPAPLFGGLFPELLLFESTVV